MFRMRRATIVLLLIMFSVACSQTEEIPVTATALVSESAAVATATPVVTNTLAPTETATSTITLTATATSTATATQTPTATQTESATPTVTNTATATATATSTATFTPLPPTWTPLPTIPQYPGTPTQVWDAALFTNLVVTLERSVHEFYDFFGRIANGQRGDCGGYSVIFYQAWEAMPAFTNVPPAWHTRYLEYRAILHEMRIATLPIAEVCANNGGHIPEEIDQIILTSVEALWFRSIDLVAATQ